MQVLVVLNSFLFNLLNTGLTVLRIPFFFRPWGVVRLKKQSKRLLILSNGPSLTTALQNAHNYIDFDCLAVNMFASSTYFSVIRPSEYVIVSPDMWQDSGDERLIKKKEGLWKAIDENTKWPLRIFLPAEAKAHSHWKSLIANNKQIKVDYFNRTPIEGFLWFRNFCFRLNLGMPRPHNVLIPSIMIGINLGYKEIFLLGADHSWLPEVTVNNENEVLVNQKHFYDEHTATPQLMTQKGGYRKLHEILFKWYVSFKSYFVIQDYALEKGVSIYNATPNSFIDAFERKDFTDL